ncbi:tripartite tricarboxylate transporter TctB family protein [Devosia sp. SL43]|uniref:tripartite tricarboxylate transporter TctB family protein n=1 Tax=Devosia sp. SL43 TaxID=2806348 RepID=UPI001F45FA18|nr:tripartite tricarboxylate transporter TctB family protein [Devosia sp. SL43]UJW84861.1 tripartite tricarboxylate transporter TctB family protein [Devosia sp. SL43]
MLYLVLGVGGFAIAQHYAFGTPRQMGPGFFPSIISGLLIAFGAVAVIRGVAIDGPRVSGWNLKGMALITGSVVAFGVTLAPLGLPLAIVISTLIAAAASEKFRFDWRALAGLVLLAGVCSIVFVSLLGVPMPLLGTWLSFIPR